MSAFVELMQYMVQYKDQLSNEQAQFVQNAIQRFENEREGQVKTKLTLSQPKKSKRLAPQGVTAEPRDASDASHGFIERMISVTSQDAILDEVQQLSSADAERIARDQGLRASSPNMARVKIAETIMTLRDIERIAGAGSPPKPVVTTDTNHSTQD